MDIKKMIKDAQELDEVMFKKGNITKYPKKENTLAYLVELGEAMNEWQTWKYWKNNKKVDASALLEELADCLHFALSLEGESKRYEKFYPAYEGKIKWDYLDKKYDPLTLCAICFRNNDYVGNTIALTLALGFTREQLVDAYYKKRNINFERAKNGY